MNDPDFIRERLRLVHELTTEPIIQALLRAGSDEATIEVCRAISDISMEIRELIAAERAGTA